MDNEENNQNIKENREEDEENPSIKNQINQNEENSSIETQTKQKKKENIAIIKGDHKKAIRKLSWPIIVSMLVTFTYNLTDTIWISGLGTEALAALGFFMPIFLIIIGLGNGVGSGTNSIIARAIGAENKKRADNAAIHGIILTIAISVIAPIILIFFLNNLLHIMGAGSVTPLTAEYATIILAGLIVLLFPSVGGSILRSEGDVKRAMNVMVITAVLNIILDPIFIYVLDLGISGAAYATLISSTISSIIIFYWLVIKKDTYLNISRKDYSFDLGLCKEIILIAIPATSETIVFSTVSLVINFMLSFISGPLGVAVYTAGWRIVNLAMIPHMGIGTATLTVVGAAFGAKNFKKLQKAYNYSIKLGLSISLAIGFIILLFAPQIAMIFSYSDHGLLPAITEFLRILVIFCIALPLGVISSSTFQGMGKPLFSLVLTIQRGLVFEIIFMYLFAFLLNLGVMGVWIGLAFGGFVGYLVSYLTTKYYLKELNKVYIPQV